MKLALFSRLSIVSAFAVVALLIPGLALAKETQISPVTHTYGVDGRVQRGMIVRLSDNDETKVRALEQSKESKMYGVVVAANEAALTLTNDEDIRQVFVATAGRYPVLVSNQNGIIKKGDLVSISAIDGVGMTAKLDQTVVLGRAIDGFSGTSNVISTQSLTRTDGKRVDVSVGRITLDIGVTGNPLQVKSETGSVTGIVQGLATIVSNKPISPIRSYLSLILLILTATIVGSILYSGVRSSITAIGRNPLARKSIVRGLVQVFILSFGVLIIGLFGVYLLLKL